MNSTLLTSWEGCRPSSPTRHGPPSVSASALILRSRKSGRVYATGLCASSLVPAGSGWKQNKEERQRRPVSRVLSPEQFPARG